MKIHDLHPAAGSTKKRTRVGRGIAGGQGKTAGRGTKGQKSRAGAAIPAWFEGGQTPLHIRIPKLRGFRNINDIEYEVVNVGSIGAAVEAGRLHVEKGAPVTVNADTLKQAGLVRRDRLPLKVLGHGDLTVKLFVLADAFTRSAREKIEAAGGTAQVIEIPGTPTAALGIEPDVEVEPASPAKPARAARAPKATAEAPAKAAHAPAAAATRKGARRTSDAGPDAAPATAALETAVEAGTPREAPEASAANNG